MISRNRIHQGSHSNRQNREVCSRSHFTYAWLVGNEIYDYIRRVGLPYASFGIWHLRDYKPQNSFPAFFSRPAGHGPVYRDGNPAVIISRAKAGDHQSSLLQLPGISGGGLRRQGLSNIQKRGCEMSAVTATGEEN